MPYDVSNKNYTEGVSTRLPKAVLVRASEIAGRRGMKLSEWVRSLILSAVDGTPIEGNEAAVALAEIVSLREILLALHTEKFRLSEYEDDDLNEEVRKIYAKQPALVARALGRAKSG